jgi:hypothetical protein
VQGLDDKGPSAESDETCNKTTKDTAIMKTISVLAAAVFFASSAMAADQVAVAPVAAPVAVPVAVVPDQETFAKQQQAFFEQQAAAF